MSNESLRKLLELLGAASDEVTPIFSRGQEVSELQELDSVVELYRYLEGELQ